MSPVYTIAVAPVRGALPMTTKDTYHRWYAGILANETPRSISVLRFLAGRPDLARQLFGSARLPTLAQYDPGSRYFESHEGTLLFTGDNGVRLTHRGAGGRPSRPGRRRQRDTAKLTTSRPSTRSVIASAKPSGISTPSSAARRARLPDKAALRMLRSCRPLRL